MLQAPNSTFSVTKGLIAVGSNLSSGVGDSTQTIQLALELLEIKGFSVSQCSRLFQSAAYPPGSGPDFVNGAVAFETSLSAPDIMVHLHAVERKLGRTRTKRWEARVLDLDLLALGQMILPDRATFALWAGLSGAQQVAQTPDQLILPHPRLQDRAFVLVPLMDIAPDWPHPVSGLTVAQMTAKLPAGDVAGVVPLTEEIK